MLRRLQRGLESIYRLDLEVDVEDFLCDEDVARVHDPDGQRREMLLVSHDGDDDEMRVALYVDEDIRQRLATSHPTRWILGDAFDDYCVGLEGVSHFVYVAFHGASGRPVTELELELQAEVDKFVSASLAVRSLADAGALVGAIRRRLFDGVQYVDAPDTERGERYRVANNLAARYAARLEQLYCREAGVTRVLGEVRRFYRLTQREKIDAILREAA
jgi:hypothetical protein